MMEGQSPTDSLLRSRLLEKGNVVGHLFSCAQYNAKKKSVTFWMCEDIFEKFKDHHVSLVRTDGWICIGHTGIRLREAEPLRGN